MNLSAKAIPVKVEFGRFVINSMTGNPIFVTPNPDLPTLTMNCDELEISYNDALLGDRGKKAIQREKEGVWDINFTALGSYVDSIAKGDEVIILSAGMEFRNAPAPLPPIGPPIDLLANPDLLSGSMRLTRASLAGARAYGIEYTTDPSNPDGWILDNYSTKSDFLVNGLTPGVQYVFRVFGIGKEGRGPDSDYAANRAL